MSDPSDPDGHEEEQESRTLLPASEDQHHAGNARDRTGAQSSGQLEDLSTLNERNIWRHFESTKRSAIFHLDQYLHHRETVRQEAGALESESLDLGTISNFSYKQFKLLILDSSSGRGPST
jgi:hypothetical protein